MSAHQDSDYKAIMHIDPQTVNNFYAESEKLLFECIDQALGASYDSARKRHRTSISIVSEKPRAAIVAVERWLRRAPVSSFSFRRFKNHKENSRKAWKTDLENAGISIARFYSGSLSANVLTDKRNLNINPMIDQDYSISSDNRSSIKCGIFFIDSSTPEYTIPSQIDLMDYINGYKVANKPNLFVWVSNRPPQGHETLKTINNKIHAPGDVFTILRIPPIFAEIVDALYTPIDWSLDKIDVSKAIESDQLELDAKSAVIATFKDTAKKLIESQSDLQIGRNYWALLEKITIFIEKVLTGQVVDPSYFVFLSTTFLNEAAQERPGVPSRWLPDFEYLCHKVPTLFSSHQITQLKEIVDKLAYFRNSSVEEGRLSAVLHHIGSNPDFPFLSEATRDFIRQNREVLTDQNIPKDLRIGNTARLIGRFDQLIKKPPERITGFNNWIQFVQIIQSAWKHISDSIS